MRTFEVWFKNQYGVTQSHTVQAYTESQARAWTINYWGQNIQICSVTEKGA